MSTGKLYLVPTPLDHGCDTQSPLPEVLPLGTLRVAAGLTHWISENAKSTRAFLKRVDALEVAARALGVLAHPVGDAGRRGQRGVGQGVAQGCLWLAAKVQRCGHQVQTAGGKGGRVHGSVRPAARSMRHVRIKGRPTRAVGSSLRMASSRLMPRPSLLALPAQS